jgi:hypothetical protein
MVIGHVFSVSIPIQSYDGFDVFEQTLLFNKSPSRQNVIDAINSLEEPLDSPYYEDSKVVIKHLIDSINQVKEWTILSEDEISFNTHVTVTFSSGETRRAPFSWKLEYVYSI